MFQKENQVSIPRFTSLARGDRSADQCLLSAAGSSTKGKWFLSTGPNSCQTALPCQARPGQWAPQRATAAPEDVTAAATCTHLRGLRGHSPHPHPVNPKCPWASLTPPAQGAKTCLTPQLQWDVTQNTQAPDQSLWAPHKSPSTHQLQFPHCIPWPFRKGQLRSSMWKKLKLFWKVVWTKSFVFSHAWTPSLSWQYHWQQKAVLQKGNTHLNGSWSIYLITNIK